MNKEPVRDSPVRAAVTRALASLRPLGSVASFSWPVLAIYCPLGVFIQAPGNAKIYGGPVTLWVLASVLGMVALGAVLAAAGAWTARREVPGPSGVIACYALAAAVQAVTFGMATVALGAADAPHLGFRLSGLLFQVPLLVVVGTAVARHDAHRRIVAELQHTRKELLRVGRSLDQELDRVAGDLATAVRESLQPAVASLEAALTKVAAGGERAEVVGAIDVLVEAQVRPLAHELAAEAETPGEFVDTAVRSPARVPLPARFGPGDAIRPGLTVLVMSVAALPTAITKLGPLEALLYLPTFVAFTWGLLTLAKRALGAARLPTVLGVPAVVGLYAVAGSVAFWLTGAIGAARPVGIAASVPGFFALVGLANVGELLVQSCRERTESELKSETLRLRDTLSLIRRRERLVGRRLAFVVHGALQGALHAAAIRIVQAEVVTEQLGAEIRDDLSNALSQLGGQPALDGSLRTTTTVAELEAVWTLHRDFDANVGESVEALLSLDPEADEAVAEVVREAVNNAFRHGAAQTVEVEVEVAELSVGRPQNAAEFLIHVRDDGSGYSGDGQPGLGTALFDDLCSEWTIGTDRRGTIFEAFIASGVAGQLRPDTSAIAPLPVS